MCGENLETAQNPSGPEANSTDLRREKWNAYMRDYRRRKKLATGAKNEAGVGEGMGEAENAPSGHPDAQTVVHLGPHGYPAD